MGFGGSHFLRQLIQMKVGCITGMRHPLMSWGLHSRAHNGESPVSVGKSSIHLAVYLSIYLSIHPSIHPSSCVNLCTCCNSPPSVDIPTYHKWYYNVTIILYTPLPDSIARQSIPHPKTRVSAISDTCSHARSWCASAAPRPSLCRIPHPRNRDPE